MFQYNRSPLTFVKSWLIIRCRLWRSLRTLTQSRAYSKNLQSKSQNSGEDYFQNGAVLSQKRSQYWQFSGRELLHNLSAYQYATCDVMITMEDKLKYSHLLFKYDALKFYLNEVYGKYFKLDDALNEIKGDFNCFFKTAAYLKSLRRAQPVGLKLYIN